MAKAGGLGYIRPAMPRLPAPLNARLAWVLAALLLWHSGLAASHCLRAGHGFGQGLTIEICSADGLRLLHLDTDEAPVTDAVCAVCHALPDVPLLVPVRLPSLAWGVLLDPPHPVAEAGLRPGARAPPYAPTGPPFLV
ncbi:hypothetical protein C8P66_11924 [Humitalea rosea]|uniref:DUF2946 family protein n=2 Tax=Humitalea rosea TaxID=990373 RepID=A0A2W7I9C4_9PROT|nr:hypothetical protein C8P66_11924 [Humitalea rosea]